MNNNLDSVAFQSQKKSDKRALKLYSSNDTFVSQSLSKHSFSDLDLLGYFQNFYIPLPFDTENINTQSVPMSTINSQNRDFRSPFEKKKHQPEIDQLEFLKDINLANIQEKNGQLGELDELLSKDINLNSIPLLDSENQVTGIFCNEMDFQNLVGSKIPNDRISNFVGFGTNSIAFPADSSDSGAVGINKNQSIDFDATLNKNNTHNEQGLTGCTNEASNKKTYSPFSPANNKTIPLDIQNPENIPTMNSSHLLSLNQTENCDGVNDGILNKFIPELFPIDNSLGTELVKNNAASAMNPESLVVNQFFGANTCYNIPDQYRQYNDLIAPASLELGLGLTVDDASPISSATKVDGSDFFSVFNEQDASINSFLLELEKSQNSLKNAQSIVNQGFSKIPSFNNFGLPAGSFGQFLQGPEQYNLPQTSVNYEREIGQRGKLQSNNNVDGFLAHQQGNVYPFGPSGQSFIRSNQIPAHFSAMNHFHPAAFDEMQVVNSLPAKLGGTNAAKKNQTQDKKALIKCPHEGCNGVFKSVSFLKSHMNTHTKARPFKCLYCASSFSRKHDLKRHTRIHTGDRPHKCKYCGRGFARTDALSRHTMYGPCSTYYSKKMVCVLNMNQVSPTSQTALVKK
ncbi:hypothetical protein BB560_004591 [Smittium megazygosporum]|uniref:C2H2-type domain-containing protein n=1 Tax=Smittium megazygosporum TaxID=133381 RepID=A0A2T9Z904_9FUNG|nr:hypothetical protein BB560_004591 [Smittium megazygosporum]